LVPGHTGNGLQVNSTTPTSLKYRHSELIGSANLNLRSGSIRFWFKPSWNSGAGQGPGAAATLIYIGQTAPNRFSIDVDVTGQQLSFKSATTAGALPVISRTINWIAGNWYQVALTYSPSGSCLYVNGSPLGSAGPAPAVYPNEPAGSAFCLGADGTNGSPAKGVFDELETFNHPVANQAILDAYNTSTGPAQAIACDLYPIALPQSVLSHQPNDPIPFTLSETGSGNFGWLDWNGKNGPEWELALALTPFGDSRDAT
jgi:hypothetical protein